MCPCVYYWAMIISCKTRCFLCHGRHGGRHDGRHGGGQGGRNVQNQVFKAWNVLKQCVLASSKLCEDKWFKKDNKYFTIAQTWTDEVPLALTCLDCLERSSFLIANVKLRKLRNGNLSSVARKQSPVVSCLYSFVDSFLKCCNWVVSTFLFFAMRQSFFCPIVVWSGLGLNFTLENK